MTAARADISRTLAAQLPSAAPGRAVRIEGWVHRRRALGAVTFLVVRDRSGLAQVVVRDPEALAAVRRCGEESVVAVTGVATRNPAAPGGAEVTEPRITLLGEPAQARRSTCGGPRSTPGCP
jgi:nondiscriminating aspartyl-tRNA synthetase